MNIKPTIKQQPSSTVTKQPSKKPINMGAATSYGKSADLGIHSPTHRNTHAEEDLFSVQSTQQSQKSNDLLEDLFSSSKSSTSGIPDVACSNTTNILDDEFNPRADDQDFGDFASAFSDNKIGDTSKVASKSDDFVADFNSAFDSAPTMLANPINNSNNGNDLLITNPLATANLFSSVPQTRAPNQQIPVQQTSNTPDLLSDFDGLSLQSTVTPTSKLKHKIFYGI